MKFYGEFAEMQPFEKKGKKKSRKASGESQPAEETTNNPPKINYSSYLGKEEFVDY